MLRTTNIEVPPAFDGMSTWEENDVLALGTGLAGTAGVVSGCSVTATTGLIVSVAAGYLWSTPNQVASPSASVTLSAANTTDRKDIIVGDLTGTAPTAITGLPCGTPNWNRTSPGAPPIMPSVPAGKVLLAAIYVAAGVTSVVQADILDKTVIVPPGAAGGLAVAPYPAISTKLSGVYVNPPVSGYLGYPLGNLQRWRASAKTLRQVVLIGDSIFQGNGVDGPYDFWWLRLARELGLELGPLISYGFRGMWTPEWTFAGNPWTQIATSSAADVSPFAEGYTATGGRLTFVKWTRPAGTPITQSFVIAWIDVAGGTQPFYSLDGGGWIAGPTPVGDNQLKFFQVNSLFLSDLRVTGGTATGAGTIGMAGLIPYYVSSGWSGPGIVVHNIGRSAAALTKLITLGRAFYPFWRTTSGSPVVSNGGSPAGTGWADVLDLIQPDLVICGFINDYNNVNDDSGLPAWQAGQTALINRVTTYQDAYGLPATDFLFMSDWEGPGITGNEVQVQADYRAATKATAVSTGAAVIDFYDAWAADYGRVGNAACHPLLDAPSFFIHPNEPGNIDVGSRIARVLRTFS